MPQKSNTRSILAVTLQKLKVEGNIEKALKLKDILAKRSAK